MKLSLLAYVVLATSVSAIPRPPRWNAISSDQSSKPNARPLANFHLDPTYAAMALATADNMTSPGAYAVTAPFENVWRGLNNDEAASVISFLHSQESLNLTAAADATSHDNQISLVDAHYPKKTDVLSYLSSEAATPARHAKARIMFGAPKDAYVEEFIVGPLPISSETTYKSASKYSTKGSAKQPMQAPDDDELYEFIYSITSEVDDVVRGLINQTATGSENDTASIYGIDPLWKENDRLINWVTWWAYPTSDLAAGLTLLPQGLFMKIDQTGRDSSKWAVKGWLWADVFYSSTEEFKAAYYAGTMEKQKLNKEYNIDDVAWISTDRPNVPSLHLDDLPAPQAIAPGGSRYSVDEEKQWVHWQDFSFYYTFSRDSGIRLFDIQYKGSRIIYELGLEEAIAHYAGNDPVQSGIGYLDTYYGFGPYAFELVSGYDCPSYATFHNTSFHVAEESRTHRNSICMFEFDMGHPIQHHTTSAYVSSTKSVSFTLRTINSVGNYDYNFDYTFFQDGSIETKVRASGYISSAFYGHNQDYGYQINDALSGSMHDHALTFKADLDIDGVKNSMAKHTIAPCKKAYPWSNGIEHSTMKLQREYIESEDEGKINWPMNGQTSYFIVNKDGKNKFGEERGYKIFPNTATAHLTIQDSFNLQKSQAFATHHLYVTKHHDEERQAAHALNNYDVYNPIIDFDEYFNGESLIQEDLVNWFVLGMHHVPHTGDLPNTVFTTAQSSMMIAPHNYLYRDPSRLSRQQVQIAYAKEETAEEQEESGTSAPLGEGSDGQTIGANVNTFGSTPASGSFQIPMPDLTLYKGDIAVRKWPYDPANPFDSTDSIS